MEEIYTQEILKNKQNRYEHITKRERDIISKHLFLCRRLPRRTKVLLVMTMRCLFLCGRSQRRTKVLLVMTMRCLFLM